MTLPKNQNEQLLDDNFIVWSGKGEPSLFGSEVFVKSAGRFLWAFRLDNSTGYDSSMILTVIFAHSVFEYLEHVLHGFAELIKKHLRVHCLLVIVRI